MGNFSLFPGLFVERAVASRQLCIGEGAALVLDWSLKAVRSGLMRLAEWWRKRRSRKRAQPMAAKASKEAGITARVDMVRFEALAEAAYDAMYEAKLVGARNRYEEAKLHFDRAIEAAHRARLPQEAARLTRRRNQVARIYNSQFRYSGGD
jgi:hypothetical protein